MNNENRQFVRWKDKIRVAYALDGDKTPSNYKEVFTEDISEHGALIDAYEELQVGQIVLLKLEFIYDAIPVILKAKVMHVTESDNYYKIGVEFIKMDDFQRVRVVRYTEMIKKDHH